MAWKVSGSISGETFFSFSENVTHSCKYFNYQFHCQQFVCIQILDQKFAATINSKNYTYSAAGNVTFICIKFFAVYALHSDQTKMIHETCHWYFITMDRLPQDNISFCSKTFEFSRPFRLNKALTSQKLGPQIELKPRRVK